MPQQIETARAHLAALQQAAALHPLSLACVDVGDTVLVDLMSELAQTCVQEATTALPCSPALASLLEGCPDDTLPQGKRAISQPLLSLLERERDATASAGQMSRDAIAAAADGAKDVDVFGNKPRHTPDTIVCTNCGEQLSHNRFAPHLERCMLGKGRASARNARDAMRASADAANNF